MNIIHSSHNPHKTPSIPPSGGGGGGFNFAKSDFESGIFNPPFQLAGVQGPVTVINDPTPRATGKVLDIFYENFPAVGNFDCNQAVSPIGLSLGLGQELWFQGDFYLDTDGTFPAIRKLTYWGWSNDTWGFQHAFNMVFAFTNSVLAPIPAGTPLQWIINAHHVDTDGTLQSSFGSEVVQAGPGTWYGPVTGTLKTWHTFKVQHRIDSAFGVADGILRLFLDGVKFFDCIDMQHTSPTWTEDPNTYKWVDWRVGQQLNGSDKMTEHRYWDNVSYASSEAAL